MDLFVMLLAQAAGADGGGAAPAGPQPAAPRPPSLLSQLPFFIILIALFYFIVLRPAQRQRAEQQDMLARLKKGDRVVTAAGIRGTIVMSVQPEDETVVIVPDGGSQVRIEFLKRAIVEVLPAKPDQPEETPAKAEAK